MLGHALPAGTGVAAAHAAAAAAGIGNAFAVNEADVSGLRAVALAADMCAGQQRIIACGGMESPLGRTCWNHSVETSGAGEL